MSTRVNNGAVVNGGSAVGSGLSGANPGAILTYTCPSGRQAILRCATMFLTNLAPTVALQANIGGTTINLTSGAASYVFNGTITLNAGDFVRFNVTTQVAASTLDAGIFAEEFLAN